MRIAKFVCSIISCASCTVAAWAGPPGDLDKILSRENADRNVQIAPQSDDLAFLRRVTIDLLGRIPTEAEIKAFQALPADQRREKTIERLLADERLADRWTVFFADMLRIRSGADGGANLLAFVHKSVREGLPYDEMCRRLISANGKPSMMPEVGYVLGDNADPMALAGASAQVFMGIRIACAQCHDHPFDVWTREQFYGFAAYFGKTRRIENQFSRMVYTTEANETVILWPPEDKAAGAPRKPVSPKFPFETVSATETPQFIARLESLRAEQRKLAATKKETGPNVDDLLEVASNKVNKLGRGALDVPDVVDEANRERSKIDVTKDLYRASQWRQELAQFMTGPRNKWFARNLVNRVWREMLGRGFVEPVDDFNSQNPPSHPETLEYLADEFVAQGYDLRALLRLIAGSQAYQRGRLTDVPENVRQEAEAAFTSLPMRRMLAESLFDSIVQAGHLFDHKYPAGANQRTVRQLVRVAIPREGKGPTGIKSEKPGEKMPAMKGEVVRNSYDLESAIEVDFQSILKAKDDLDLEQMQVMSKEELEAMQMMKERQAEMVRYVERYEETTIDDNPKFASAMRMASPADPAHFLRIFGQPARDDLGDHRDESPSMRQALMMLNGKLTHEASRVGDFEPVAKYIAGETVDVSKAVSLVYREILTREPSAEELADAKEILHSAASPRDGMADLRWVLFNSHEFRFLP